MYVCINMECIDERYINMECISIHCAVVMSSSPALEGLQYSDNTDLLTSTRNGGNGHWSAIPRGSRVVAPRNGLPMAIPYPAMVSGGCLGDPIYNRIVLANNISVIIHSRCCWRVSKLFKNGKQHLPLTIRELQGKGHGLSFPICHVTGGSRGAGVRLGPRWWWSPVTLSRALPLWIFWGGKAEMPCYWDGCRSFIPAHWCGKESILVCWLNFPACWCVCILYNFQVQLLSKWTVPADHDGEEWVLLAY